MLPVIFAEIFGRPHGPVSEFSRLVFPRIFEAMTLLLEPHIQAGRLHPVPLPLLIQQLVAPVAVHTLLRPTLEPLVGSLMPPAEESGEVFTSAFLRAMAVPSPPSTREEGD